MSESNYQWSANVSNVKMMFKSEVQPGTIGERMLMRNASEFMLKESVWTWRAHVPAVTVPLLWRTIPVLNWVFAHFLISLSLISPLKAGSILKTKHNLESSLRKNSEFMTKKKLHCWSVTLARGFLFYFIESHQFYSSILFLVMYKSIGSQFEKLLNLI